MSLSELTSQPFPTSRFGMVEPSTNTYKLKSHEKEVRKENVLSERLFYKKLTKAFSKLWSDR